MIFRPSALVPLFVALLAGCSSGSSAGTSGGITGSSSGGPGDPVTLPDGSTVPTVACGDENVASASGTWDVLSSGPAHGSATIQIDASSFVFTQGNASLAFSGSGSALMLTWSKNGNVTPISVVHGAAPVDTGLLPLGVGGDWTFTSANGAASCTATLAAASLNASCNDVSSTPLGNIHGKTIGLRQTPKTSVFGALGGVWHFTGEGSGTMDVTISGNVFTAVLNGNTGPTGTNGWMTMKICNGTAAGKASSGFEYAATKR